MLLQWEFPSKRPQNAPDAAPCEERRARTRGGQRAPESPPAQPGQEVGLVPSRVPLRLQKGPRTEEEQSPRHSNFHSEDGTGGLWGVSLVEGNLEDFVWADGVLVLAGAHRQ
mmetsp:Transcript_22839/g.44996  ORF Transcript_22839/g.44996 Transcript_22839/m.44996 type:complete len:112 (-) Transcript_22839:49-384(-)